MQSLPVSEAEFRIGSVLGWSFSVLIKYPFLFFGLTLIATLPSTIVRLIIPQLSEINSIVTILDLVLTALVQGAITYGVYQALKGKPASIFSSISQGMARISSLVMAATLIGIGVGLGMILYVVPGIILMSIWSVAIPACVVEELRGSESIRRSYTLTSGYRWPIFLLILLPIVVIILIEVNVAVFIGRSMGGISRSFLLIEGVTAVVCTPVAAFNNVMAAILYFELRKLKEGIAVVSLTEGSQLNI